MDQTVKNLIQKIKLDGYQNEETTEVILRKIQEKISSIILQKRAMIERTTGEIGQLLNFSTVISDSLRLYINEQSEIKAEKEMEDAMIAQKKKEADERLKVALESDGVGPGVNTNINEGESTVTQGKKVIRRRDKN